MHLVHEVLNYLNNLPPSTWTTVAAYLGGSTLVASVLQFAKHKFKFADAQKVVAFALGFFSFIAAFADFLIQNNPNLSALPFIGHATGLLVGGAFFVHRFAVSPAYYKLSTKLQRFEGLLKEAEKDQLQETAVPAEVVASASAMPTFAPSPLDESNLVQFTV